LNVESLKKEWLRKLRQVQTSTAELLEGNLSHVSVLVSSDAFVICGLIFDDLCWGSDEDAEPTIFQYWALGAQGQSSKSRIEV